MSMFSQTVAALHNILWTKKKLRLQIDELAKLNDEYSREKLRVLSSQNQLPSF